MSATGIKKTLAAARVEWALVDKVLKSNAARTVYIWGPPGCGKTYCAFYSGVDGPDDCYAITLTPETSAAELRGHYMLRGSDTVWHDGPFTRAMREGKRLVVNEITHAGPDVLALLYPVLESFETASLTLPTGEQIKPESGFNVVATDNNDPHDLPDALQDRFVATLHISAPHPAAYSALGKYSKIAARGSVLDGARFLSARDWTHLMALEDAIGLADASRAVFGKERGEVIAEAVTFALANDPDED